MEAAGLGGGGGSIKGHEGAYGGRTRAQRSRSRGRASQMRVGGFSVDRRRMTPFLIPWPFFQWEVILVKHYMRMSRLHWSVRRRGSWSLVVFRVWTSCTNEVLRRTEWFLYFCFPRVARARSRLACRCSRRAAPARTNAQGLLGTEGGENTRGAGQHRKGQPSFLF